jgi:hypothetical protein
LLPSLLSLIYLTLFFFCFAFLFSTSHLSPQKYSAAP